VTNACRHRAVYRLTCDEYRQLRARAGDRCEICRTPEAETPGGRLLLDHDDSIAIWAVRGLLCVRCNTAIGRWLDQQSDPRVYEFLSDPWYRTLLLRAGLTGLLAAEPAVGGRVAANRIRYSRQPNGWTRETGFHRSPEPWRVLNTRHRPDHLRIA
jgi:hypothetical protein